MGSKLDVGNDDVSLRGLGETLHVARQNFMELVKSRLHKLGSSMCKFHSLLLLLLLLLLLRAPSHVVVIGLCVCRYELITLS
jgi:hypothetical protein